MLYAPRWLSIISYSTRARGIIVQYTTKAVYYIRHENIIQQKSFFCNLWFELKQSPSWVCFLPSRLAFHHMLGYLQRKLYSFHQQLGDLFDGVHTGFNWRQADVPTGTEESNRPGKEPQNKEPDNRPQDIHGCFCTSNRSVKLRGIREIQQLCKRQRLTSRLKSDFRSRFLKRIIPFPRLIGLN